MATINILGRLGKDPEVKFFDSGNCVAKFTIGDVAGRKDDPTNWFDCEIWGKRAQLLGDTVSKGQRLMVSGDIKTETWTAKDGGNRSKQVVRVSDFQYIESRGEAAGGGQATSEEIPF
ncbi:predicted protein [Cyanophage PSS2]|uniref:cyanobacterial ssDNAbp n=1 Tax=Cyanophage PSS2 TaxID=658401 RepID=UPI0001B04049|nr:cyanobacterial ssDNAbp [Cyanophage PSS2]ACT65676.1 cyanobacterial ssDNAbp [Cyanophage PSS2]ACY75816.1 predicted protein [Cyanophage PSS2]